MSFSGLRWRPELSAGSETWTAELPMRPWVPGDEVRGGWDESAAGVPAAFVVREQERLRMRLRFYEHEWPDLRAVLREAMRAQTLTVQPDQDEAESFDCYLLEPRATLEGLEDRVIRSEDFREALETEIVVRRTDGEDFDLEWRSSGA